MLVYNAQANIVVPLIIHHVVLLSQETPLYYWNEAGVASKLPYKWKYVVFLGYWIVVHM